MGLLSIYLKPNFLGLLKCLNNLNLIIVFFSLINLSVCIYEDQIGKFDWRQTYVGRIKFSQFDTVSTAKKIIVATEENVLAALNLKTVDNINTVYVYFIYGTLLCAWSNMHLAVFLLESCQVVWRHVFESASTGNIQLLHVTDKVVTVSGSDPYLVRGWDSATGVLLWEWSLSLQNEDQADFSEWWVQDNMLVHMLPVFGSHIEVSMYNLLTGQNRGSTSKLPAIWINDGCVLTPPYYTCISGSVGSQLLISLDVTSNAVQLISRPLSEYITYTNDGGLRALDGNRVLPAFAVDDRKIVLIKDNQLELMTTTIIDPSASVALLDSPNGPVILQSWIDDVQGFTSRAHSISTGAELPELRLSDGTLKLPEPEISSAMCTKSAREQLICRILFTGADDSMHLMQQGGRILWSREEALANVVAVEFVELPVSDLDAAIESEFDQKEGSIWAAFSRRLQTQFQQLQTLIQNIQNSESSQNDVPSSLVRDYFGLHKVIVLVTDVGKIFGMDNLSGAILWQYYEANLDTEGVLVFTRRTARHPPHDAYITIVGKHEETGNGLIISLNPITGSLIGERLLHLDVQLLQCALLHQPDSEKLHALIVLDKEENVQIFPISAAPLVENMFMYVAERNTARVQGYAIVYDGKTLSAPRTWQVRLGGAAGQRVVLARAKQHERAHSAGRVLPDRSVLYKYVNPNLVLFVTEGPDQLHKDDSGTQNATYPLPNTAENVTNTTENVTDTTEENNFNLSQYQDRILNMLTSWKTEQDLVLKNLTSDIIELKKQVKDVQNGDEDGECDDRDKGVIEKCGECLEKENNDLKSEIEHLKKQQTKQSVYISVLEQKIEEMQHRPLSLDVINILCGDNKEELASFVVGICRDMWDEEMSFKRPNMYRLPDVVVATCVDAASGAIVASQIHRRARALPLAVHTEHYLAYLYYNDKHRRTEIATLELYEGKQRWLPAGAAFSSLASERAPSVERQAFILSAAPTAAATTVTERSLTDKHVLLALSSGAIVEVPWVYLEARRGLSEEGAVMAYAPEVPLGGEARLNYNRTLARPRQIHAAPAGLESTSLVLTTGLDLFYTRVAPSKTFDLLKDDFDYYLITVVLAGLIVATYSTKYFASRKMLKLAWK